MRNEALDNIQAIEKIKANLAWGNITYSQAKQQATPILLRINAKGRQIAKKYGKNYKEITFSEIMR